MTPQEALQVLYTASERAMMRGQDHAAVRQAVDVINNAITPKEVDEDGNDKESQ